MCEISCKNSERLQRKWQKNFRGYFFGAHCRPLCCRTYRSMQEDVNNMMFVVHQDSLKTANIVSKMDELNLHLEQAVRQFHKDRHRKQVDWSRSISR